MYPPDGIRDLRLFIVNVFAAERLTVLGFNTSVVSISSRGYYYPNV
jgi:hypothetical protein